MTRKRIVSVDIFRGLTIALMILVNNPGSWSHIYSPFKHAEWFGVTPTDWVFPFFLFIVGTSIVLAYHNRDTKNLKTYKRIIERTLKLLFLSWFLAGFTIRFPFFKSLSELRIPGVLFRIGIVFFFAALIFLLFKKIQEKFGRAVGVGFLITLTVLLLTGYWYVMIGKYQLQGIPTEILLKTKLNKTDNLVSVIDRKILGVNHMWRHWEPDEGKVVQGNYDPEGLLSTIPALATTLLGMFLGFFLIYISDWRKKMFWMFLSAMFLLAGAFLWEPYFPFSKKLWTSSYALYMSGLAFLIYALLYLIVEILGVKKFFFPFKAMGMNAIAVFVLNGFIAKIFYMVKINGISLHNFIFENTWNRIIAVPELASLMYAISVVLFYILLSIFLYRKKIFIKV